MRGVRGWTVATPVAEHSAEALAVAQLVEVHDVLAAAGIRPFVTDRAGVATYRLGVFVEDRQRALDALRATDLVVHPASATGRLRAWSYHHLGAGLVVGPEHSVEVEFWVSESVGRKVPDGRTGILDFDADADHETTVDIGGHTLPSWGTFAAELSATRPDFPIDVVYTWVDGSDPEWRAEYEQHLAAATGHPHAANESRFTSRDELRSSMRSLWWNADFFRNVYVVTWGHIPEWLVRDHPRLTVVTHDELIGADALPTFNSHAIESRLHHIDGLAEHFLYMNDDVLIGRPLDPTAFFTTNGLTKVVVSSAAVPQGEVSPADAPVDAAAKNGISALKALTGRGASRKLAHTPRPLRRSVLEELEERLPDEFARTTAARFRSPTDLSIPSFLAPYYALATDRGVFGDLDFVYVNIADRWAQAQMDALLLDRDRDVVCINETTMDGARPAAVNRLVVDFLDRYFPKPSPFEK